MIRARGVRPWARATSSSMISTAEAPSLICDDVPAVCRPSGRTGFSPASPSSVVSRRPWSVSTSRVAPVGLPSASSSGASMAAISRLKRPSSTAARAFCCEARPKASRSSRVRPRFAGDPVGRLELVGHVDRPVVGPRVAGPGRHVGAQRDAGHRLDAAGDADLDGPGRDHVVDQVRRHLARAALGVDHGAAGVLGKSGVQPGAAHHAVGLLTGLGDAAADDLLDEVGVEPGAPDHLGLGEPEQDGRVDAGQPALALAEGSADGFDDDGVAHGPMVPQELEHVLCFDRLNNRVSTGSTTGSRHGRPPSRMRNPFLTYRQYVVST